MPYKLKESVRHKFSKKLYNKRDWKAYEACLVKRGSLTIWFNEEAISKWNMNDFYNKKRGRPRLYSDLAIETCHTLRLLQKQALRQTQGFVSSIINLLKLNLIVPDHTTLSRRLPGVILPKRVSSNQPVVMLIVLVLRLRVRKNG